MTGVAVRTVLLSTSIFALAACDEGFNLGSNTGADADAAAPSLAAQSGSATRDVERPDIFETTETALWDGRPSLGGVWVAHPDVTTPERAIVTNTATNQRIAAALFRREREIPGPRIQLSSDAASRLNILAGAPTEVTIIAVRPEEIEVEAPEPVLSDEVIGEEATPEDAEADAVAAEAEDAAEEQDRRPNFLERIFGRRSPAPEAAAATGAAVAAGAEAAASAAPTVETQTLDPVTTGAAAAIARADATSEAPQPRPERTAPPSELRNPFVQVGVFSEEANAFSARDNLRSAGILPTVLEGSGENGPFWRVIVGPITSTDDQAQLLGQLRSLGFRDAFLTPQ